MLAIDTNVVVRYLTGDHPEQSAAARVVIDENAVFVATTVLLETEWVLRSVYEFSSQACAEALTRFAGLPNVTLEDPARAARALTWTVEGLDFADALHLAAAAACEAFVSFDKRFIKAAEAIHSPVVRAL
ncbi:type II toxin-antitoxin system VapC family toxin [Caulobacter sp. LARHSG274]